MKQELNYSRYVDRYLDGVMSVSEKNWFEKELKDNAELQAEIDLQKKINKVLSDQDTFKLQAQLDEVYLKTYRPWNKTVVFPLKKKTVYLLSGIAGQATASRPGAGGQQSRRHAGAQPCPV